MFKMIHQQDSSALDLADRVSLANCPVATRYDNLEPTLKQAVPQAFPLDAVGVNEPQVFQLASMDGTTPRAMISRAVLLLRAATAMNVQILDEAGFSQDDTDVRPWLDPLLVHRGIVAAGGLPDRMADLWDSTRFDVTDDVGLRGGHAAFHQLPSPLALGFWPIGSGLDPSPCFVFAY